MGVPPLWKNKDTRDGRDTKDSAIGGRNLTAEIQRQLNLSYTDAETLKVGGHGGGMPQEVMELMRVMAENFAGEIKKALDFYNASSSGAPVSSIWLCNCENTSFSRRAASPAGTDSIGPAAHKESLPPRVG